MLRGLRQVLVPGVLGAGLLLALTACGAQTIAQVNQPTTTAGQGLSEGRAVPADSTLAPVFAVGVRQLQFSRGADRPLPTTVWYPAAGRPGAAWMQEPAMADGRFPVILFSHGLTGQPSGYRELATRWAAAGFVVVAPAYPHTKTGAAILTRADIPNQPADASTVITGVLRLSAGTSDLFSGHLDPEQIAAAGHSAGGYTTAGLLSSARDARIRAAIIISGAGMGDAPFVGAPTPMLFIHGDADPVVTYARGRAAFGRVPWPKAFVTLAGQGHGEFLQPGHTGFEVVVKTSVDFLRWALLAEASAAEQLVDDATDPYVSRIDALLL